MADEAVLRIIMQTGGSAAGAVQRQSAPQSSTPTQAQSATTVIPGQEAPSAITQQDGLDEVMKVVRGLSSITGGIFAPLLSAVTEAVNGVRDILKNTSRPASVPSGISAPSSQPSSIPSALPSGTIPDVFPAGAAPAAESGAMSGIAGGAIVGAVALAAKKVIDEVNKAVIDGIRDTIGSASKIAQGIGSSNTDPSATIGALGEAASKAGEGLANFIPELGYVTVALGEAGKAISAFMQAANSSAQRYGEYSPLIAQAQAMAEIRQITGDMRRSREGEPELARYVKVQADLQQKFEDIKIKLLTRLLSVVNPVLEILEMVVPTGNGIENAISLLGAPLNTIAGPLQVIQGILAEMADAQRQDVNDPTDAILGIGHGGAVLQSSNLNGRDDPRGN